MDNARKVTKHVLINYANEPYLLCVTNTTQKIKIKILNLKNPQNFIATLSIYYTRASHTRQPTIHILLHRECPTNL